MNQIAQSLTERLPEWYIESESDCVARAYNLDWQEAPPKEDVVSVSIRTDYNAAYYVSSSAWNESRGMGDLVYSEPCDTLAEALDVAERFRQELTDD